MIDEIIDKEDDLKNEVVAAYGEVLRKLKNKHSDEKPHYQPEELKPAPITSLSDHQPKTPALSEFRKNILNLINNIDETIHNEEKKLAAIEKEISAKMQQWQKEEREYITRRDIERKEEEKHYIYQRDLKHEKDRQQYEMEKKELEIEMREHKQKMQAREQDYIRVKEKEAWIAAKEDEYHSLKERIDRFPDELKHAVQKAERAASENLTVKYEYEMKLIHNKLESEHKLHEQTMAALIAKHEHALGALNSKHEQAIAALEAKIAHLESLKYSFNKLAYNSMETSSM
jgi:chromosome segregation ATPase